jgi:hypothetical protein
LLLVGVVPSEEVPAEDVSPEEVPTAEGGVGESPHAAAIRVLGNFVEAVKRVWLRTYTPDALRGGNGWVSLDAPN